MYWAVGVRAGTSQIFFTQYCTIIAAQIKAECYIYLRWVSCDLLYDLLNHKPSLEWFSEVFLNIKGRQNSLNRVELWGLYQACLAVPDWTVTPFFIFNSCMGTVERKILIDFTDRGEG